MWSKKTHLKIKIKSLAAEARIIRSEEHKWKGDHPLRETLHNHRVHDVRKEARCSQLAYGFLRGREYRQLETKTHEGNSPNWDKVESIALRFGGGDSRELKQLFEEWKNAA